MSIHKTNSHFLNAETVFFTGPLHPPVFLVFKRLADYAVALALLPFLLLCAGLLLLLNRRNNPGPLIYRQERVGYQCKLFVIYKFRTMSGDCPAPRFAIDETGRISRLGDFLRRTRIDELPQILNVLKGEMSMVGPRPEQVVFFERFDRAITNYRQRQMVLPGITGLAQLKYGYTCDEPGTVRKLHWDLEYIRCVGFGLESHIMLATFLFVFGRLFNMRSKTAL